MIRLNKYLAQSGVASRREADRLIQEGRVSVNGEAVCDLGIKIDDEKDQIKVNGRKIRLARKHVYLMLHKPPGLLVTMKDPFNRPTVVDLIPEAGTRIFPVGRLDFSSEGLLLLTSDGELAHRLMHPRYQIEKVYLTAVRGIPAEKSLEKMKKGVYLDGKKTAPAKVSVLDRNDKKSLLKIAIHEGRKREVRRMCQTLGHSVVSLKRIQFGRLTLGRLKRGEYRHLSQYEIDFLKKSVGL